MNTSNDNHWDQIIENYYLNETNQFLEQFRITIKTLIKKSWKEIVQPTWHFDLEMDDSDTGKDHLMKFIEQSGIIKTLKYNKIYYDLIFSWIESILDQMGINLHIKANIISDVTDLFLWRTDSSEILIKPIMHHRNSIFTATWWHVEITWWAPLQAWVTGIVS